ncbi:MAG: DNA mismatch repair endonuclease MutL [Gammaproteobacteria bacterium]
MGNIPRITKLPRTLANQIAAGEVIERPASVVKELLENAFDAGADAIDIELDGGGSKRIRVRDNGHGIHPDDMQLALERHSTSKLQSQNDLACISSLGFRGEALASIAAAARFTLTSRIESADNGWCLQIDPVSNHSSLQPRAHPFGTSVVVENLFQAIPARKKFLRTERTEFLQIHEIVKRLALSRFGSQIRLSHNGKIVMNCRDSSADPRIRVQEIFGKTFADSAISLNTEGDKLSLWGWLGLPRLNRSQTDLQYTFINGRLIRDQRIARSIRLAYADQVPNGRYPAWVLYLEMDPALLDVNVHPAKSEVRFNQPRNVHNFIHSSVQNALADTRATGLPGMDEGQAEAGGADNVGGVQDTPGDLHTLHTPLSNRSAGQVIDSGSLFGGAPDSRLGKPVLLLAGRYVICSRAAEHILVDARGLHDYLLRERLRKQYEHNAIKQRPFLVPVMKPVSERHFALLEKHRDRLERAGIGIRLAGVNTIRIDAVPALLEEADIDQLLQAICLTLEQGGDDSFDEQQLLTALCDVAADTRQELSLEKVRGVLGWLQESDLDSSAAAHNGLWCVLQAAQLAGLLHGK